MALQLPDHRFKSGRGLQTENKDDPILMNHLFIYLHHIANYNHSFLTETSVDFTYKDKTVRISHRKKVN